MVQFLPGQKKAVVPCLLDWAGHLGLRGLGNRGQVPLHRFGEAGEIAKAALFLASDDPSFMTGAEWVVAGGITQL